MPLGVPHSVFLGRIVRPGRDPQWTDADRSYALAWSADKRATCGRCGTRADEWDEDEDAYISDHFTCPGCERLQEHERNNLDRRGDQVLPGQHTYLKPREQYEQDLARRRAEAAARTTPPDD